MVEIMESGDIVRSLHQKSILVTGSTGFLAKIFVEKVLRVQPDVRRLFLLIRARDSKSATQRLQTEVLGKEVFRVLREKHGGEFDAFVKEKVFTVVGDIGCECLGITDSVLKEELWREVDVVVNCAATTNFDERYDVALDINTMGAKHVLEFAKKCKKLQTLLHVSTAYVAGTKSGLILEKPFQMGETFIGSSSLDVEAEMKLVERSLKELRADAVREEIETAAMKDLGLERAKVFGWPNTYVFTKAMGEMLIGHLRGDLPLVIIRPTIVASTFAEPFPGWMEGTRTIDSLIVGYGKGKLTCFLTDPELVMDVIPGDMVVNAMIVSMVAHSHQLSQFVYHVGSSVRNPVTYSTLADCAYHYFSNNPCLGKDGKLVMVRRVSLFNTMAKFRRYMTLYYKLPLQGLEIANATFCQIFRSHCSDLNRKYAFVMRLAELYEPYVFFKGRFDDLNLERLRVAMQKDGVQEKKLCFDPKCIKWNDYFTKIHIPGLVKYVLK